MLVISNKQNFESYQAFNAGKSQF